MGIPFATLLYMNRVTGTAPFGDRLLGSRKTH